MSVTRDAKGNSGLSALEISEITYMEFERSLYRIVLHTKDEVFYTVGTLKYWVTTLKSSGYNFVLADRNTLINVKNIVQLDKTFHVAYFGENRKGVEQKCFLSEKGYKLVVKDVKLSHPNITFIELPLW
ncbi:LytTR family transcriptional regulator DNA-binding domain-containing protein [Paenibacillus sp. FSL R7-0345]|uniref:LytTR family transcriptional regulator DNA-binding domain-containing protein n=1 Tax=Paenibacillus sp. FSL R7-0345 TaxID=2954535 RepID=UPI00315B1CF8